LKSKTVGLDAGGAVSEVKIGAALRHFTDALSEPSSIIHKGIR
jgi:hypothetical protein